MGAYRNVALSELPIRGISINDVAASDGAATVAVVASDSGVVFVNKYITADTVYTLPAVADAKGKMFWFFNAQSTKNLNINGPANTIMINNDAAADNVTSAAYVGEAGFVICDGEFYYFFEIMGTWA